MDWIKPTPRTMVVAFYCGAALLWSSMLLTGLGAAAFAVPSHAGAGSRSMLLEFAALALHALAVAVLAWKLPRWFFGHGGLAVSFCALPIIFLVPALWIVAALLYAIGVAYVWEASRRERPGQLQAPPRARERGASAPKRNPGHTNHMFG
jgi:hypothetical protein